MKSSTKKQGSVTQPLLQDLMDREALNCNKQNPMLGSEPLKPANLYQDDGGGFNRNYVFPQA